MRVVRVLLLCLAIGGPAGALAQERAGDLGARAAIAAVPLAEITATARVTESDELRRLRELEQEALDPRPTERMDPAPTRLPAGDGRPSALDPPESRARDGGSSATRPIRFPEVAFLASLDLPELSVRWDERMLRYLAFFRDDPRGRSIIESWVRRSGRYRARVTRILRELGAPEDLYYVAMIESGFDPNARSSVGAVGLWQLTEDSARTYGLEVSHWVDERRDPEASTRAAARYLLDLRRRFGSWELALAAYNMGYSALSRSVRRYGTNDFWELARLESGLPWETSFYVSKAIACAIITRNAARFGITGPIDAALETATLRVNEGTPIDRIASAAGVSIDTLRTLNPELLRSRVPPGRTSIRVPTARAASAGVALDATVGGERLRAFTVRLGDSLDSLAARSGTTAARLAAFNDLAADAFIRPGDRLLVPAAPLGPVRPEARVVATLPAERFELPGRRRIFYRVAPGDALGEVARGLGVTPAELVRWNQLDPRARLQSGMILQALVAAPIDPARVVTIDPAHVTVLVAGSDAFYRHPAVLEGRRRVVHVVSAGETMRALSNRYGLSVGSISRINRIPRDSALSPGQRVIVYTRVGAPAEGAPPTR